MFNTICVGFDGSDSSTNALRVACDLAGKYGASVHVVHTPHPETVALALGAVAGYAVAAAMPSQKEVERATALMFEKARAIASDAGQSEIQTHLGQGETGQSIVMHSKACGADLIVTGRRGLGNISTLVLGSTSQSVGHLADCAHLTVK